MMKAAERTKRNKHKHKNKRSSSRRRPLAADARRATFSEAKPGVAPQHHTPLGSIKKKQKQLFFSPPSLRQKNPPQREKTNE